MSSVYSDKFGGVAFRSGAELARFEADACALWAVKVLDRAEERGVAFELPAYGRVSQRWYIRGASYLTADAARLAAAEALVAENASLGEGL